MLTVCTAKPDNENTYMQFPLKEECGVILLYMYILKT